MKVPKIWRKIPEYYCLIGKKCKDCNELFFPSREVCQKCGSLNLLDYQFKGKGKIITFTIIRTNTETELEKPFRKTPYVLAIIQLEEGPMLTAEITDLDYKDLNFKEVEIGKNVEFVFRKIVEVNEKSVIQYGYKFKLV
ncbi:MAG: Zn-ribbon domain-containing OB-fold protein [Candidatus Woesearchaeota archaeon]